jgi:hypothetical protein
VAYVCQACRQNRTTRPFLRGTGNDDPAVAAPPTYAGCVRSSHPARLGWNRIPGARSLGSARCPARSRGHAGVPRRPTDPTIVMERSTPIRTSGSRGVPAAGADGYADGQTRRACGANRPASGEGSRSLRRFSICPALRLRSGARDRNHYHADQNKSSPYNGSQPQPFAAQKVSN